MQVATTATATAIEAAYTAFGAAVDRSLFRPLGRRVVSWTVEYSRSENAFLHGHTITIVKPTVRAIMHACVAHAHSVCDCVRSWYGEHRNQIQLTCMLTKFYPGLARQLCKLAYICTRARKKEAPHRTASQGAYTLKTRSPTAHAPPATRASSPPPPHCAPATGWRSPQQTSLHGGCSRAGSALPLLLGRSGSAPAGGE